MRNILLAVLIVPFLAAQAAGQGLGAEFCLSEPNSTGSSSSLVATGNLDAQANDLTLTCSGLPTQQFGIYLFSFTPGLVVNPGGTGGVLCLGNPVGMDTSHVINTGLAGIATRSVDLTGLPQPNQVVAAQAGDTLHFQFWHRDVLTAGSLSNFSPGLRVQLQCEEVLLSEPVLGAIPFGDGAFGDFDGDGAIDLAFVGADPFLSILLGDGEGEFGAAIPVPAIGVGIHVLTLDVDADGDLDIVATRHSGSGQAPALMLFRGDGQAGFVLDSTRQLAGTPTDIAAADFNGDGWIDYVLPVSQTFEADLVTSAPGGGLDQRHTLPGITQPRCVVAEDFDGDGDTDLAFARGNTAFGRVATFANDGTGNFTMVDEAASNQFHGLCATDVDADGDIDIILGGIGGGQTFENDGFGGLSQGVSIEGGQIFLCRDMNSDGLDDLVGLGFAPAEVMISLGTGAGGFAPASRVVETRFFFLLDAADVDGDGYEDILARETASTGLWTILRGSGPGVLVPSSTGFTQQDLAPVSASGDYDGDGRTDIAWGHSSVVEIGYGDGTRSWPPARTLRIPVTGTVERMESEDLDNDGDLDFAVTTKDPAQLIVLEDIGGAYASRPPLVLAATARDMALKDVNGDGAFDILLSISGGLVGAQEAQVFSNTGGLSYSLTQRWPTALSISSIDAGDFDGDGLTDIVFGNGVLKLVLGSAPTIVLEGVFGGLPWDLQVSDLDGDGRDEILSLNNSVNGHVAVTKYDPVTGWTRVQEFPVSGAGEALELYDVEGDGVLDLVVGGTFTSIVMPLRGRGSTFGPLREVRTGTGHEDILLLDFDGDGITDLVTVSPSGDRMTISWGRCR